MAQHKPINAIYQELVDIWTTSLRYNPESRVTKADSVLYDKLIQLYEFIRETVR